MTAKDLKSLLQSGQDGLAALVSRASAMQDLRDRAVAALPEPLREHVSDVSVDAANCLVVGADSAAWATRLRYESDTMLTAARRHGVPAARCIVRVRPLRQTPATDTK